MMRHPMFAIFAIALVLLSACGREYSGQKSNMSEAQAFEQLSNVPLQKTRDAFGRTRPSAAGLVQLLEKLVAEGKIKQPQGRGAINLGNVDLTQLMSVFTALSGGANSIGSLGSALSGTGTTSGGLNNIVGLLNMALPIITMIAPQYAPIVQGLVVILPMVMTFMNMFKKPKAMLDISFAPVAA